MKSLSLFGRIVVVLLILFVIGEGLVYLSRAAGGEIDHFEVLDLAKILDRSTPYTFRVVAYDVFGDKLRTYDGTIAFSSSDIQADLPAEYTFEPIDNGERIFDLGVSFGATGRQNLAVVDKDNPKAKGSVVITVKGDARTADSELLAPSIDTPSHDTVFNIRDVDIHGSAVAGSHVSIYDGSSLLNEVDASGGDFNLTASDLSDGAHNIVAEVTDVDGVKLRSELVRFFVDTSPPVLKDFRIKPEVVHVGDNVRILLQSEKGLESVKLSNEGQEVGLKPVNFEDSADWYSFEFPAKEEKKLVVDVILVDKAGNKTVLPEYRTIQVYKEGEGPATEEASAVDALDNLIKSEIELKPAADVEKNIMNLQHGVDKAGRVLLAWDEVPEATSYRLSVANTEEGDYVSINTEPITDNRYLVDAKNSTEKYYLLEALDDDLNIVFSDKIYADDKFKIAERQREKLKYKEGYPDSYFVQPKKDGGRLRDEYFQPSITKSEDTAVLAGTGLGVSVGLGAEAVQGAGVVRGAEAVQSIGAVQSAKTPLESSGTPLTTMMLLLLISACLGVLFLGIEYIGVNSRRP